MDDEVKKTTTGVCASEWEGIRMDYAIRFIAILSTG